MKKETTLRRVISEATGKDVTTVDSTVDLIEYLALDSIDGLRVIAAIERKMNVTFPDESLGKLHTITEILETMEENAS